MGQTHRLGDLQLAIMRVLWGHEESSVAAVHEAIHPTRGLALTTIATMLRKMEDKGVVAHRVEGRTFHYHATIKERDVHRTMVRELTDQLFGGDALALVNHLIDEREINPRELERLRALIDSRENVDPHSDMEGTDV